MNILWVMLLLMTGLGIYYFINNIEKSKTPLEVLNKRYAGGRMTKEEYERMKTDIK